MMNGMGMSGNGNWPMMSRGGMPQSWRRMGGSMFDNSSPNYGGYGSYYCVINCCWCD